MTRSERVNALRVRHLNQWIRRRLAKFRGPQWGKTSQWSRGYHEGHLEGMAMAYAVMTDSRPLVLSDLGCPECGGPWDMFRDRCGSPARHQ